MSKELEALLRMYHNAVQPKDNLETQYFQTKTCYDDFDTIKSALEQLEIIKKKKIDFRLLKKCDDANTYNYLYAQRHGGYEPDYMDNQLTVTEFNLLKEMLK